MLKNYLKIAWRNLLKHKGDTAINIVGLCVAFTAALLIFLSVFFEFSFDKFHKNRNDIYHVYTKVYDVKEVLTNTALPVAMLPSLKEEYPEVEGYARYMTSTGHIRHAGKELTQNLRLTDPDFFSMFSFPFIYGDARSALADLNSIVLSERSAKAIFNDADVLGRSFQLKIGGEWRPFVVSAVAKDVPENSSITFDMLIRFENSPIYQSSLPNWDNWNHSGYIQLKNGVDAEQFSKKLKPFFDNHFSEAITSLKRDGAKPAANGSYMEMGLLPLPELHTTSGMLVEGGSVNRTYLYLLLVIGGLILLIACINFINLSIGRSFTRSHEIGLRKTLGALRWQIVSQLWMEALLLCFMALVVSSILTYVLLPHFKQLFQIGIRRELLLEPFTWLGVMAGFLLVTLVAGGYPAWLIARVNIISILKGKFSIRRSNGIRNGLIIVQFAIAVLLMICTLVTWRQVDYLRSKSLGYNREQVISIPIESQDDPNMVLSRFREKVNGYPNVESVSGIYNNLGRGTDGSSRSSVITFDYKDRTVRTAWMGVSHDFVKTLDLQLVAGRDFSREFSSDSNAIVINEAMARQLGEKDVIGLQLPINSEGPPTTVIGVVKDFNFESLQKKIEPLSFTLDKDFGVHYALVKVAPANLAGSMDLMKKTWRQVVPNSDFKGSFLDDNIDRQYRKEKKMGQIFISGAVIAIILSCMGLFAMVLLIVTQRVKEIGIRKVLGAGVANIVLLISRDFLWLVILGFLIAAPLAWVGMQKWLEQYAYRIGLHWWFFAVAAVLAFAIAFLTISIQAFRAAVANPVKSLKTE